MIRAQPTYISSIPRSVDLYAAETGARLLGLGLKPQGRQVAGVLEARGRNGKRRYREVVVQMSRRTTKTTSIWSVIIGRCATIPGYTVVTTAQDGSHASDIITTHMELLEANGFEESGLGQLYWSNGRERIRFANGSVIKRVTPKPGAFRSAAADLLVFDEAGELDAEIGPRLRGAALPLLDSRDDPQIIITGTPGKAREGLLWEALKRGRSGSPRMGIVDYSLREDEVLISYDEDTGEKILHEDVLRRVHPGIGTITTMAWMREQFETGMQPEDFEAEYGCRWPADGTTGAFDLAKWEAAEVPSTERPERVGIAFDVNRLSTSASLVYAWRDEDGHAYVELVAHRPGTAWLPATAHKAWLKYRRVPVAHDAIGSNFDPATALLKMRPAPRLDPLTTKHTIAAAQRFASELHEGRLRHFGQSDLTSAAENTSWRDTTSGRAFGARDPGGAAVNPIVAASLALWSYDRGKDRQPLAIVAS